MAVAALRTRTDFADPPSPKMVVVWPFGTTPSTTYSLGCGGAISLNLMNLIGLTTSEEPYEYAWLIIQLPLSARPGRLPSTSGLCHALDFLVSLPALLR